METTATQSHIFLKDEFQQWTLSLIVLRIMEIFRLDIAMQLPGLVDVLDINKHLQLMIESIIQEQIGFEP